MDDKEKLAKWMIDRGYSTGHGDTIEDLLSELHWQINENWNSAYEHAMEKERDECAKVCDRCSDEDGFEGSYADRCAEEIRKRR
jgi:hypothetical protein